MKFHIEPACFAKLVQSSCTSPYLEAESAYVQNMQGLSQLKCRSAFDFCNTDEQKQDECVKLETESLIPGGKTGGISSPYVSLVFFFVLFEIFFFTMIERTIYLLTCEYYL